MGSSGNRNNELNAREENVKSAMRNLDRLIDDRVIRATEKALAYADSMLSNKVIDPVMSALDEAIAQLHSVPKIDTAPAAENTASLAEAIYGAEICRMIRKELGA